MKNIATLSFLLALSACSMPLKQEKQDAPPQTPQAQAPQVTQSVPNYPKTIDAQRNIQPPAILYAECASLARYARDVAVLRDRNIKIDDIPLIIENPPANLALGAINREVYSRPDIRPEIGHRNSYEACVKVGYEVIQTSLAMAEKTYQEEEAEKLKKQLESKRSNNTTTRKIVNPRERR